jgi:GT2 family glycosyltransferase
MKESPNITIQMVGWNSGQYFGKTLPALKKPLEEGAKFCFIDNGSSDGSAQLVRQVLPEAEIIELKENMGYARAHNIGLKRCMTDFVLIMDPDMSLQWEGVLQLLGFFSDSDLAAAQGKILRPGGENVIDSTGIVLSAALNGRERGAFERDHGQFDAPSIILGPTGACALYRLHALRRVAYADGEIFDESFFSYKEDVDLNWRISRAGFKAMYYPIFVGNHHRTLGRRGFLNWGLSLGAIWQRARNPRTYYSTRNWVWMIVKNVSMRQLLTAWPFIIVRAGALLMVSVLYPPLSLVWLDVLRGLPQAMRKRKAGLGKAAGWV